MNFIFSDEQEIYLTLFKLIKLYNLKLIDKIGYKFVFLLNFSRKKIYLES